MMPEFKVLTLKDRTEWTRIVENCDDKDIYFLPEYLEIYEQFYGKDIDDIFHGEAILFFYGTKENYVLQVFIKRKINDLEFMSLANTANVYYDLISPYGYSGPLYKGNYGALVDDFLDLTTKYCVKNNIVCEFIRFHPLLNNHRVFENKMNIVPRNKTVFVDLTLDERKMLENMDKKHRTGMRKAIKNGVSINKTDAMPDFEDFIKLYLKTMDHNNARKEYFLPISYFKNTKDKLRNLCILFIANYRGAVISAALFLCYNRRIHYHFSGSDKNFSCLSANNLLLFEVMKWAKEHGFEKLHLGGGNSSNEADSLFKFKIGFSKTPVQFYTANRIHNHNLYKEICELRKAYAKTKNSIIERPGFFPEYRA